MKRSIRRHQKKVAQLRKLRIVLTGRSAWWKNFYFRYDGSLVPLYETDELRLWRPVNKQIMLEPGWWIRETVNRPARVKSRRQCRLVVRGQEPDSFRWPDHKKPQIYYW
jgi:hypothetical protein